MYKYLSFFILSAFIACSGDKDNVPDDILKKDQMVNILAEMHIAEAIVKTNKHLGDTDAQNAINSYGFIYKKYGVTDSIFRKSYYFYLQQPVLFDSIYVDVITKLSDKQVNLRNR